MSSVKWVEDVGVGRAEGDGMVGDIVVYRFILAAYKGAKLLGQWGWDKTTSSGWASSEPEKKAIQANWAKAKKLGADRLCAAWIEAAYGASTYIPGLMEMPAKTIKDPGAKFICYNGYGFSEGLTPPKAPMGIQCPAGQVWDNAQKKCVKEFEAGFGPSVNVFGGKQKSSYYDVEQRNLPMTPPVPTSYGPAPQLKPLTTPPAFSTSFLRPQLSGAPEDGTLGVTRWYQDFYVYSSSGQVLSKSVNGYLSLAEGRSQSKYLWNKFFMQGHKGHKVCSVWQSKNTTECYDGVAYSQQLTTSTPITVTKGPKCPPDTVLINGLCVPKMQTKVDPRKGKYKPPVVAGVEEKDMSKIQWLGAIEDTQTYQACIGKKIQDCGTFFPNLSDPQQKKGLDTCIEMAKITCKSEAEVTQGWTPSKQEVMDLQNKINVELKKYDYCPIGVDGNLGGQTCGAAIWAKSSAGAPIAVPQQCNYIKNTFQLKECPPGGGPVVVKTCPETPCPAGQDCISGKCYPTCPSGQQHDAADPSKCVPIPTKTASEDGGKWGLLLLAGAAAGAIFLATRAPKLPAREAERLMSNPTCVRRRWYLFFYEPGMRKPKEAHGPYTDRCEADSVRTEEVRKYGKPSRGYRYVVKHLTDAQFTKTWGTPPA